MLSLIFFTCAIMPALGVRPPQARTETAGEQQWKTEDDTGRRALEQGRYPDAIRSFQAAIAEAEKLGNNQHLADSATGLAQVYVEQGNYAASEPLFQQALGILEETSGPNSPAVAIVLNNLATAYRLQEE